MYGATPYYFALFICHIPLDAIPQLFMTAITYNMVKLGVTFQNYIIFASILILENFIGIAFGMLMSTAFDSVDMAPKLAPLFVIFFLVFSGYFIPYTQLPGALQ